MSSISSKRRKPPEAAVQACFLGFFAVILLCSCNFGMYFVYDKKRHTGVFQSACVSEGVRHPKNFHAYNFF